MIRIDIYHVFHEFLLYLACSCLYVDIIVFELVLHEMGHAVSAMDDYGVGRLATYLPG